MTYTLLIRLAGPLQAWGTLSKFHHRDTDPNRPTKSGVIGLLAAADGHNRTDINMDYPDALRLEKLAALRFGVRADRPGVMMRDYHTVGGGRYPIRPRDLILDDRRIAAAQLPPESAQPGPFGSFDVPDWYGAPKGIAPTSSGALQASPVLGRSGLITERWYLADAAFVAAVESDDRALLNRLADRLDRPRRMVWLGRKSCPPAERLNHGVHEGRLEGVLTNTALLPNATEPQPYSWLETSPNEPDTVPVQDQPESFSSRHRVHTHRWERRQRMTIANPTITWDVP
ncbi:type I-E CRISPR-associated protein Cas5/CasD [Nocardia sp. NBC_01503]|uniref:type I-E CRISPR-associated protein Cas5/CasD n=1 Tax=Nocardia sp. NBC_01503 TaxID=2975997 RepID=UPI002E7BFCAB|nr:type I-E CRISPR-associated protein Cas5/CasD [Nocardia sp. NBC_01503]WTL32738.1 type I-E CRISPR-associated protein Cas5/CasD [Nocardia sp. NBC_01503]